MKLFFAIGGLLVALMWMAAELTLPSGEDEQGRTVLVWSTDPNPARREQLAPFSERNPDLVVQVEPNSFDRTIVQCATGVGPDIIEIYNTRDMAAYAQAGILLDLTEYARELGFGPESTYPRLVGNLMYDGRQYRYPANAASQVLIYNKRMFDEAGIPYPADDMLWEDFIELVKPLTVKAKGGRGYQQFALVMGKDYIKDLLLQFGASFFNESRTECTLDSPLAIDAMNFYRSLIQEHELIPSPSAAESLSAAGGWGHGEIRWFASGKAASIWGSRWMMVIFRQYPELHPHLGVATLPRMPGGAGASFSGTRGPGINAKSERIDEALKFMQYLASEEYAEVIAMSSDGLPPLAKYSDDPDRLLNPEYPMENYQEVFVESMRHARPLEVSPFVDPFYVGGRVWVDCTDNISNDIMMPEEALKLAARQINQRIERNVRERPDLREKYEAALKESAAKSEQDAAGKAPSS